MSKKITNEEFIAQSIAIHGDKYNYSKVEYNGRKNKVSLICNKCLDIFSQTPSDHIFRKSGCPNCGSVKRLTTETFISKANKIHDINKFDYSKVNYINARSKIIIKCNKCDSIFLQKPADHLSGYGCIKCPRIKKTCSKESIIKRFKLIHNDLYDYSNVNYITSSIKVSILCLKCTQIFNQYPSSHLQGKGCPNCCATNISKKETKWLDSLSIPKENRNFILKINNKTYKPDAFDLKSNTIYEFYGDYWHGNPSIFNPSNINKNNKKTFEKLYEDTLNKEKVFKSMGYNIISIWEKDWDILHKGK